MFLTATIDFSLPNYCFPFMKSENTDISSEGKSDRLYKEDTSEVSNLKPK